jgi:hypothetical protein
MSKFSIVISLILLFASCSSDDVQKKKIYSQEEKKIIESYSKSLQDSINAINYHTLTSSWDLPLFQKYFIHESKISKKILRHFLQDKVNKAVGNYLLNFTDKVSKLNGNAQLLKIAHHGNYSDISFSFTYADTIEFAQLKVKLVKGKPKISDVFSFSNDELYSESLKKALKRNVNYTIQTDERKMANLAINDYMLALDAGEYEKALVNLLLIPETHQNDLSLVLRLDAAEKENKSLYSEVLLSECTNSEHLYIKYKYASFFGDSIQMKEVLSELTDKFGNIKQSEAIKNGTMIWKQSYIDPNVLLSVYKVQFII